MAGTVFGIAMLVLVLGVPLFLAAYPGICALTMRRSWLAASLFTVGLLVTFGVPTFISRMRAESGVFRDDWFFFVDYLMYGVVWALTGIVVVAITGKRAKPTSRKVNNDPPGGVASWIADMRRTEET